MSCTVMYQPYAMSYTTTSSSSSASSSSSSCEKSSLPTHGGGDKKLFKLPLAPSPSESLHSDASSYSSPGPSTSGSNHTRRPLTPVISHSLTLGSQHFLLTPPSRSSTCTTIGSSSLDDSQEGSLGGASSCGSPRQTHHLTTTTNHSNNNSNNQNVTIHHHHHRNTTSGYQPPPAVAGPSRSRHSSRVHYISSNAAIYLNYDGDVERIVQEHFDRTLKNNYGSDKPSSTKCCPMSNRNFPPSFWNSNYTGSLGAIAGTSASSKALPNYSAAAASAAAAEFYGAAVDYGGSLQALTHHQPPDPWHYSLAPPHHHQSYHHRPTDIAYPPLPSSRFNPSQYGSFLLGAAASTGAGRFSGMATPGQCGVVNVKEGPSGWPGGRYHHHHHHHHHEPTPSLTDFHNLADYSAAAAAAHYSNMAAAGLESTVQDSSKDLYWF